MTPNIQSILNGGISNSARNCTRKLQYSELYLGYVHDDLLELGLREPAAALTELLDPVLQAAALAVLVLDVHLYAEHFLLSFC